MTPRLPPASRLRPAVHTQRGFSLLEILVAIIVLSIGLLGLAGLQVSGMKANQGAYLRTQANALAYDIIERMRANVTPAITGAYVGEWQCAGYESSGLNTIAARDIDAWMANLAANLPECSAAIATTTAGGEVLVTVTVRWSNTHAAGGVAEPVDLVLQTRLPR